MNEGRWIGAVVCLLVVAAPAVAQQQDEWSWPERAENLKQLPADFPGQRLRAVMTGFTRALGVRCSHCHVGAEGQPLSSYDFASDDNPNKNTARKMLEMLGDINDHLKEIEPSGPQRVNMWCHTCHNGRPRPMRLGEELLEVYDADGLQATLDRFRELRDRFYGAGVYNFSEASVNALGYALLGRDDPEGAIAFFRLNVEYHPSSANAWDSLAEGYMTAGRDELAAIHYSKSLELDPDNENALEQLRRLREKAGQG